MKSRRVVGDKGGVDQKITEFRDRKSRNPVISPAVKKRNLCSGNFLINSPKLNPSLAMKRAAFPLTYLTVLSTLAFAQLPNPPAAHPCTPTPSEVQGTTAPPLTPQPDEYVPNNNEAFFPGGSPILEAYLKPLDLYPLQARETQLEGTVRVAFQVQPSGHLAEFRIVRSRGLLLDRAALEVATRMPRWYPAHRGGVAVASLVVLPITFRLD